MLNSGADSNGVYALAYVPVAEVLNYYEVIILDYICEKVGHHPPAATAPAAGPSGACAAEEDDEEGWLFHRKELKEFVTFLHTWTTPGCARSPRTGKRDKALFDIVMWNQFCVTPNDGETEGSILSMPGSTNNPLERYNRTLKQLVGHQPQRPEYGPASCQPAG